MPLYIRDDRVKELATEVAARQRSTVTDAVRDSLVLRRNEMQDERDGRRRRIDEVLARFEAEPDLAPGFADKPLGAAAAARSGYAVGTARNRDNDPAERSFSGHLAGSILTDYRRRI
jgi:hypothetical protein